MKTPSSVDDQTWLSRQTADPEFQRAMAQEATAFEFINALEDALREKGITKAALADKLGKSRAFVTQAMRRGHNLTFKTAGDLAWACGMTLKVSIVPADKNRRWATSAEKTKMAVAEPGD